MSAVFTNFCVYVEFIMLKLIFSPYFLFILFYIFIYLFILFIYLFIFFNCQISHFFSRLHLIFNKFSLPLLNFLSKGCRLTFKSPVLFFFFFFFDVENHLYSINLKMRKNKRNLRHSYVAIDKFKSRKTKKKE